MEIYIPLKVSKADFSFNLLAVWNFYSACKQVKFKGLEGPNCLEFAALEYYRPLMNDPVLVAGDLNFGPTFAQAAFLKIVEILEKSGLKSLYHEYHALPHTESKNPTFRSTRNRLHHLDHIFGSRFFSEKMKTFQIDDLQNVVLSDHAPLVLDLNI